MQLHSFISISSLSLIPLLSIVSAYPQPVNLGTISASQRAGSSRPRPVSPGNRLWTTNCRGTKCREEGGDDPSTADSTSFHFSSSEGETGTAVPDAYIFHGPDGDAEAQCQNPLPVNVLFTVEEGHGCKKMANIYNDVNTSTDFNCKKAIQQKPLLCGEAPHYGALAQSCYDFLVKQDRPRAAVAIEDYRGLCSQG